MSQEDLGVSQFGHFLCDREQVFRFSFSEWRVLGHIRNNGIAYSEYLIAIIIIHGGVYTAQHTSSDF